MSEVIRVMLVDDKVELRQNMRRLLSFDEGMEIVGEASNGAEAVELAQKTLPDLVLMDIRMPVMDGIQATELITARLPVTSVIVVSVLGEPEYMRRAMQAGAREFLVKPFSNDDLVQTIRAVHKADVQRTKQHQQRANPTPAAPSAPAAAAGGQVITVFSTKGGVGKTTLALNLAVSVRRTTGRRVCIVDCDMKSGDVALLLNLAPVRTLADLVHEDPPWTKDLLAEYLTHHGPSGVDVLAGPVKPEWAEAVQAAHVGTILTSLRQMYDYVFVDTTPLVRDLELTILDHSSTILMVTAMDVPSIKNVRQGLDLLAELKYPPERIKVVLNRSHSRAGGIEAQDVALGLHRSIASLIPAGGQEVAESGNKGDPFMLHDRSSEVAASVQRLAESLLVMAPPGQPEARRDATESDRQEKNGLLNRFAGIFGSHG